MQMHEVLKDQIKNTDDAISVQVRLGKPSTIHKGTIFRNLM